MYSNYFFRFTEGQKQAFSSSTRAYPNSTLKKIIFPLDRYKNEYDIDFYQPEMTHNTFSIVDIDLFFRTLYHEAEYFDLKTITYLNRITRFAIVTPLSSFITLFIIHLLFFRGFPIISTLFILCELITAIWTALGIVNVMKTHKRIEFNTMLKISDFLGRQNITYFENKGMRWTVPKNHFNWLELHLEYKTPQEQDNFFQVMHNLKATDISVIIFPLDEKNCQFESQFYNAELTDNHLSKSEVDMFLKELKELTQQELKVLRLRKISYIGFGIAAFIGFIGLILINISNDPINGKFIEMEKILLGLYLITVWVVFLMGRDYLNKALEDFRSKIKMEVQQENPSIMNKEVRWYFPSDDYRWIELWLDYRFADENEGVPIDNTEPEDITKYRFRDAESLPLYQWGQHFNFGFKPKKKEMDYMNTEGIEDQHKLFHQFIARAGNPN